ncbi:MAG TPA: hypothetical protein DDY14_09065 [Chromatiaceae bacterium]|jgi:hypothetical protein|nr:MAG: hypothetical protein N838_01600 [Thiohalocapsa sp. PB-PSB1]QQO56407.1 MAG: hypothetical protein N838_26615 [Thiohalocapsa sp. PB-PSB1]HBG95453.1 hypothetical protein [Chromatiaceae bacterium]HCS92722.1 hypothetical protein [Chromatiaceae bacterium]
MSASINKPYYIDPALRTGSASLASEPPFVFRDVTARVFPIKANPARLYSFCARYLNMDIPTRIAHFRPSIPYVYVMVLDYGRMAVESIDAQNLGWVSQHEVVFTVPLTWWREEHGRLVFKDWAFVSPFIFVDNELSQTTGREVYGWPKVAAHLITEVPLWTQHPRAPTRMFSLCAQVFPKIYAGQRQQRRVLMQIDRDPPPSYSEFPPDSSNPWSPLRILPTAASSALGLMGDAMDMLSGLRLRGYRRSNASMLNLLGSSSRNLARLLPELLLPLPDRREPNGNLRIGRPELQIQQITLKQFHDTESPNNACYQALVASSMGFDRLNRGALMGDVDLLRGDPSGGFSLRIHRYPGQPIVESLGMQVTRVEQGEEVPVDVLKPTLPFWTDVDLFYDAGRVICSRTPKDDEFPAATWRDEQEPSASEQTNTANRPAQLESTPAAPGQRQQPESPTAESCHRNAQGIPYNTARGAATQPITGPFHFPDLTIQVYPLLAERKQLEDLLTRYLNQPLENTGYRFELAGSYVYMMVTLFGEQLGNMWSESNNIGWWADREVAFCVPIKWFQNDAFVSLGLISPFVFANSGRAAITDREVNGRPTVDASIEAMPDEWLSDSGPVAPRRFLRVSTEVFPALHLGQQAQQRTLIEIDQRDSLSPDDADGWRLLSERWGETLIDELERKQHIENDQANELRNAKALARQILAQQAPTNWFTLKQYRDAGAIDRACYQAIVHTKRSMSAIYDLREIDERVHVRLHRYPGQPIAESLGLRIKQTQSQAGAVVQELQPFLPFWMRLSMSEELGQVLCWRTEDGPWSSTHPRFTKQANVQPDGKARPCSNTQGILTSVGAELAEPPPPGQSLYAHTDQWLRARLHDEATEMSEALQGMSEQQQQALLTRLAQTLGQHKAHDHIAQLLGTAGMGKIEASQEHKDLLPTNDLLKVIDGCREALGESLQQQHKQSDRLSRDEAHASLLELDDIQVVIEKILREQWEHQDQSKAKPKPSAVRVRSDSVGSAKQRLEKLHPELLSTGDWWYLHQPDT